ncbi:MAG: CIA30 family protein [Phycisphaerales bacterium]|nr:MAG: CIA30 family protein [Phycisphaerales bacterium]
MSGQPTRGNEIMMDNHRLGPLTPALWAALSVSPVTAAQRTVADFADPAAEQNWTAVNDDVMGGVSEGRLRVTSQGTLEFFGTVSLQNNGGFASIRSLPVEMDLSAFEGLKIRVRGDGKRYAFNVRTDVPIMAGSYRVPFDTQAGAWQEIFLPFAHFQATSFGRVLRDVPPVNAAKLRSFGFTISDKQEGPFKLEVEWIQATNAPTDASAQDAPPKKPDTTESAKDLINLAITRGVPLFNNGQPEACAAVYEITATSLIRLAGDELPPSAVRRLEAALAQASQTDDGADRAWLLRYALDDTIEALSAAEPR